MIQTQTIFYDLLLLLNTQRVEYMEYIFNVEISDNSEKLP